MNKKNLKALLLSSTLLFSIGLTACGNKDNKKENKAVLKVEDSGLKSDTKTNNVAKIEDKVEEKKEENLLLNQTVKTQSPQKTQESVFEKNARKRKTSNVKNINIKTNNAKTTKTINNATKTNTENKTKIKPGTTLVAGSTVEKKQRPSTEKPVITDKIKEQETVVEPSKKEVEEAKKVVKPEDKKVDENKARIEEDKVEVAEEIKKIEKVEKETDAKKPEPIEEEPVGTGRFVVATPKTGNTFEAKFASGDISKVKDRFNREKGNVVVIDTDRTIGNGVIMMKEGIVVSTPSKTKKSTINIYSGKLRTYISGGYDMQYISSDGKKARVKISGFEGTVDLDCVELIPTEHAKEMSYYFVQKGEIRHRVARYKYDQNKNVFGFSN